MTRPEPMKNSNPVAVLESLVSQTQLAEADVTQFSRWLDLRLEELEERHRGSVTTRSTLLSLAR